MGTRREFLHGLVGGLGLAGLAGCRTTGAEGGERAQVLPTSAPPKTSVVALVRPTQHASLAEAVKAVVAQAGGLGFIRDGQRVLIKPAVNSAKKYPATSDPEVVLTLAKLVLEAGGVPFIADRTMFMHATALAFHALGFDDAAHEAGVSCQPLDNAEVVGVVHPLAAHWSSRSIPIYRPVADADHVINVCTPRTHRIGDFTMSLKNLVGVVQGSSRMGMHMPGGFKERLAELTLAVPPSLVVMDGREGFTDGGPDEGDLAKLDFLAASADPLAIDAVGLAFLRSAGANQRIAKGSIWNLGVMKRAAELGLGASAAERIRFTGLAADDEARLRKELA